MQMGSSGLLPSEVHLKCIHSLMRINNAFLLMLSSITLSECITICLYTHLLKDVLFVGAVMNKAAPKNK